jgi:hypothetical protein
VRVGPPQFSFESTPNSWGGRSPNNVVHDRDRSKSGHHIDGPLRVVRKLDLALENYIGEPITPTAKMTKLNSVMFV